MLEAFLSMLGPAATILSIVLSTIDASLELSHAVCRAKSARG